MRSKTKEERASPAQFKFLEGFIEAYALTEPNTPKRTAWREGLHGEWTSRYGKLKGNEKNLINTYFKNQTRPGGKREKEHSRQGCSKEVCAPSTKRIALPAAVSAIGDPLQVVIGVAQDNGEGGRKVLPSTSFVGPEHLPEANTEGVAAQSTKLAGRALEAQILAKNVSASWNGPGPQVGRSERPIVRRYEGVENLVADIELPGLSPNDVQIFYENMNLQLFAKKADNASLPASLRHVYEANLLNLSHLQAHRIVCGMKNGLLRVVLQREGPEEATNSPHDQNLQVLDYVPFNFK
ncbi:hypothetical protein EYR36_002307 [Pleurotus pulmonarius]|nr:hypothetical protein EYR36_002307 [Pleurotus pulmonarius]